MIFAKIDFINLLPFHIYTKRFIKSTRLKQIINYKKSYPSNINKQFYKNKIDAAFISSIKSYRCKCLDIGIVAKNEVDSVLLVKGDYLKDSQSDTSNVLAKVLKLDGEIIIGDKALYRFYNEDKDFIDLAQYWKEKYDLPFVFARLCINNHYKYFNKLSNNFLNTKVYIPQYILKQYAKKTNLTVAQIKQYLTKITYKLNYKEKQSLKLFLQLSKKV